MDIYSSYYEILNIPDDASLEDIKSAFRKLALVYHPDKNNNSPESQAQFIVLYNAYTVLIDTEKRSDYDRYLRTSSILKNQMKGSAGGLNAKDRLSGKAKPPVGSLETVISHINFLFWEIEDFIRKNGKLDWERKIGGKSISQTILKILIFIDKWVLTPSGYPDYFLEARRITGIDRNKYFDNIQDHLSGGTRTWGAFVSCRDYFYNLRKRMDKLMKQVRVKDLVKTLPENGIRIIDCIFEAQNLAIHYLSFLNRALAGEEESIPPFKHSNPHFES